MQLRDEVPASFLRMRLKNRAPAAARTPGTQGRLLDLLRLQLDMLPEAAEATVDVLERNGIGGNLYCPTTAVVFLVYGYGDVDRARSFLRRATSRSSATSVGTTTSYRTVGAARVTSRSMRNLLHGRFRACRAGLALHSSKVKGFSEIHARCRRRCSSSASSRLRSHTYDDPVASWSSLPGGGLSAPGAHQVHSWSRIPGAPRGGLVLVRSRVIQLHAQRDLS